MNETANSTPLSTSHNDLALKGIKSLLNIITPSVTTTGNDSVK